MHRQSPVVLREEPVNAQVVISSGIAASHPLQVEGSQDEDT